MKKKLLVLADFYRPAQNGGGAVRSLETQVEALGNECEFHIITRNHDLGDSQPYAGIAHGTWNGIGKAQVYYARAGMDVIREFLRALKRLKPDYLYVGSVVAIWFSIVPVAMFHLWKWMGRTGGTQLLIAPRGQLGDGALRVKALRKRVFLAAANAVGFHSGVIWHASGETEALQIARRFGRNAEVRVAMDIWGNRPCKPRGSEKKKSHARLVYISRVSPEKNLLMAIHLLYRVTGRAELGIYGPIHSRAYWESCVRALEKLPKNISARYGGALAADDVLSTFAESELFLFPTAGESFGHVVLEALSAGCPVLCSDRTPWNSLEQYGCGWTENLEHPDRFISRIEQTIDMDAAQWQTMSRNARHSAETFAHRPRAIQENRGLFGS